MGSVTNDFYLSPTPFITDALSHGEILLMIDIPSNRVLEIENFVHHKYPEAVVGGFR